MIDEDIAPRVLRSLGAATFSQLWRVGVTFATHLILRRHIAPQDWGLYDWAEVVFLVLGGIRDLGMNGHVLRLEPRPFGNLLLVEAVWGATLVLLGILGAPWIAHGLAAGHPQVVPVLRALTLFLFLEGLAAVPLVFLESELRVSRAVLPEVARNLCFAVTSVSLALAGKGVWSIVVGQIAGSAVFAAILWARAGRQIPWRFHSRGTFWLLAASHRLTVIWLVVLLVRYVDRLVLGAMTDTATLGTYGFAYWAAFIAATICVQPVGRVAYPAFIAYRRRPRRQFDTYRLSTVVLLCVEVPTALFLFSNAGLVLDLIGGARGWPGAEAYLRVLCFAPLIDPLSRLGGELLMTGHRDRWLIVASSSTLASFVLFGVLFTSTWGARGMAWANYLPLGGLVMFLALRRLSAEGMRRLLRDLAWVYLLPVPLFGCVSLLTDASDPPGARLRLALSVLALCAAAVAYTWRFGAELRDYFRDRPVAPDGAPVEAGESP